MAERIFTQTFSVVGAIIEKDGKILLVKEKGGHDKGKWNQPAGWIEVDNDPITEIVREVKEETGLTFNPTGLLGIYSIAKHYPEGIIRHGIKLIFRGTINGNGSPDPDEVEEIRWFTLDEINKMGTDTLRDLDIKQEVQAYLAGKSYPLEIILHTRQ